MNEKKIEFDEEFYEEMEAYNKYYDSGVSATTEEGIIYAFEDFLGKVVVKVDKAFSGNKDIKIKECYKSSSQSKGVFMTVNIISKEIELVFNYDMTDINEDGFESTLSISCYDGMEDFERNVVMKNAEHEYDEETQEWNCVKKGGLKNDDPTIEAIIEYINDEATF